MTDHVIAVSEAIAEVRRVTGRDVHLMGYSQGGMFAYQAAAYRQTRDVASIVTFGIVGRRRRTRISNASRIREPEKPGNSSSDRGDSFCPFSPA